MTGPSHDDANRTPTEERATDLLQRFFNRTLTEKEAGELLKYWNARPELHGDALDHFDTETLLPFLAAPRTLPPGRLDEWIDAACRRFDRPTEIGFDADELARLAAASPALPKPEPENEKIAARETRKRPVEAYDAAQTSGSHRTLAVLLPLILAAFMVAVYVEWSSTRKTSDDDFPLAKERPTPAILVDRDDVRWTAGTRPPELGEPLLPGVLAMESGTIELLFYNGVRGIVEGPAELLLIDEKRVFCKQGRWSVTVPPQGRGFEIQTASLTVRDLGTRFYAAVEKDRCDVHVVEGTVETERADGTKTVFETGTGAGYRSGELLRQLSGVADGFLTRAEMRKRSDAVLFHSGRPEAAEVGALRSTAMRTIDFSRESVDGAAVHGGERVDGPVPGTRALRFAGPRDHIRLNPLGKFTSMTVVVRMRIDRPINDAYPILMTEGAVQKGLVWNLLPDGRFIAGFRRQGNRVFRSPVAVTPQQFGRWLQFALVVDGTNRLLSVYMNGGPVLTENLTGPGPFEVDPLDLGCWKMHAKSGSPIRRIDGAVGETLIFDRALDIGEIRLLQQ